LTEWGMIGGLFAIGFLVEHLLVWAAVTVLLGSRQHALGLLGHESVHFTAAKSKRVNDVAAELMCFWPLVTGLAEFRRFHLAHHRHFGTERDPELLFKHKWSRSQFTLPATRGKITRQFLLDCVGFGLPEVIKAQWMLGRNTLRGWMGPIAWWACAGPLLYTIGLGFAAVIWFAALCTSFWGFHRLRVWTEHVGTDATHRIRANWWQRILITPHGSWSHPEHHAYPSIPFWRRHVLRPNDTETVTMGELFASFATMADRRTRTSGESLLHPPHPECTIRALDSSASYPGDRSAQS
jgi:fatty acid desaturase